MAGTMDIYRLHIDLSALPSSFPRMDDLWVLVHAYCRLNTASTFVKM